MKERVTVSLSAEVAERLKTQAAADETTVSAYVESVLEQRLRQDLWLARWVELAGPLDENAVAYATRSLLQRARPDQRSA